MRVAKNQTANTWRDICLAVVGEQFDSALQDDAMCGVSVSIRKGNQNVASFWNMNARSFNSDIFYERVKEVVPCVELKDPSYKPHFAESDFGGGSPESE